MSKTKIPKTFSDDNIVNVIIETPKGCRNKYAHQPDTGLYELTKVLPAGTDFPLDFGFIPRTEGEDGDPLDVLVFVETDCFPGCLLQCRIIGIMEAMQKEKGKKAIRNDRIIAVAKASIDHSEVSTLKDVNKNLMKELIHFFEYYNSMSGKKFTLLGLKGPKTAIKKIKSHLKK